MQSRRVSLVTEQESVPGYRTGECPWLQNRRVSMVTEQESVPGYRTGECPW